MIEDSGEDSDYGYSKENNGWTRLEIVEEEQHIGALRTNIFERQNQQQNSENNRGCEVKYFHRNIKFSI